MAQQKQGATRGIENRADSDQTTSNTEEAVERPLPGSTTGTVGGGGPDAGPTTPRAQAPEAPRVKPENAASGRLDPDPLAGANEVDPTKTSPGDTQPH